MVVPSWWFSFDQLKRDIVFGQVLVGAPVLDVRVAGARIMCVLGTRHFWSFVPARATIVSLITLLMVSVMLNFWQFGIIQGHQAAKAVAQGAASRVEPDYAANPIERKAAKAQSDKRVDQLYQEIEKLGQMSDRVLMQSQVRSHNPEAGSQSSNPARMR